MTRFALLILTSLIGLVVAGCGSSDATKRGQSSADREQRYEAVVRTIHSDMNDAMGAAFGASTLDATRVRTAKETAQQAVRRMETVTTPDQYADAHEQYLEGLEAFAAILDDVEQQVDDPNVARRHLEDERFSSGVQNLERASKLYSDAGFDLEDSAPSNE
jgi:hypothetical protein